MIKGYFWGFLAPVFWGIVYVLDDKILGNISPFTLLFFQSLFTVFITFPFVLSHQGELLFALHHKQTFWFSIFAIIAGFFASYSIYSSIQSLSAVPAAFLEISYPLFIILFGILFFGETVKPQVFFGGLLIIIGSAFIVLYRK